MCVCGLVVSFSAFLSSFLSNSAFYLFEIIESLLFWRDSKIFYCITKTIIIECLVHTTIF